MFSNVNNISVSGVSFPELADTSPESQQRVEDMAAKIYSHGDKCVIYNLSFAKIWNDWDKTKANYLK